MFICEMLFIVPLSVMHGVECKRVRHNVAAPLLRVFLPAKGKEGTDACAPHSLASHRNAFLEGRVVFVFLSSSSFKLWANDLFSVLTATYCTGDCKVLGKQWHRQ